MAMDAITLLTQDHRTLENLFERLKGAGSETDRKSLFHLLETEFEAHASAEEQILYPLAESLPESEGLVEHAYDEHEEARTLLRELGDFTEEEDALAWKNTLEDLRAAVDHHVKEEEGKLFPMLRQIVTDQQLKELGDELQSAKEKLQLAS